MRNHPSQSFQFAVRSPGTDSWHPQRHPNFTKWLGQPGCKQRQRDWLECHSWNGRKSATFTALLCMFHSSKHVPIDQTTSWTTSINYHLSIVYIIIISVIPQHQTPRNPSDYLCWVLQIHGSNPSCPATQAAPPDPLVAGQEPLSAPVGPKCMSYSYITISI